FGRPILKRMTDRFHELDPDRLVHYEGIFHDRRYPDTSDMESQMYPSVADIEAFLDENPEKPFICCEYTHAMGNSCGGMHKYTDLSEREPRSPWRLQMNCVQRRVFRSSLWMNV
ncbi:MAG: beta-galactosidase, partial [Eubacterium sp.]|nr:beta-galactosidase [Eubacterium sp.]